MKASNEAKYKNQARIKSIILLIKSWKSNNSIGINREKSNIAITIMETSTTILHIGCTNVIFVDCSCFLKKYIFFTQIWFGECN